MSLRVLHVITTLDVAGAELLLARLVEELDPGRVTGEVVCLSASGAVAGSLEAAGWPVTALGMQPGRLLPRDWAAMRQAVRRADPAVVHTWMYHADLLGGLAGRLVARAPVLWSLHQSALPAGAIPRATRGVARLNAGLSWVVPRRIVATSASAIDFHASLGYRRDRMTLIPSAFSETEQSAPGSLRRELRVPPTAPLIGRVGRLHAQKDYPTLVRALVSVLQERRDAHAVLIGRDVVEGSGLLPDDLSPHVRARIHLLGPRVEAAALSGDFDIAVSSSAFGESTPLVIGEAMAAGTPVVTTDVGDSAHLVGTTGLVVPPQDHEQLSTAILRLLALPEGQRRALGERARARVRESFSMRRMADAYTHLYESTAG